MNDDVRAWRDRLTQMTTDYCAKVAYSCGVFAHNCTHRQIVHYHVLQGDKQGKQILVL